MSRVALLDKGVVITLEKKSAIAFTIVCELSRIEYLCDREFASNATNLLTNN